MTRHAGTSVVTALLLIYLVGIGFVNAGGPTIRLNQGNSDAKPTIDVIGLSAADLVKLAGAKLEPNQWTALFSVYVASDFQVANRPATLGSYRIDKEALRFEPRFPLTAGLRYRAVFDPNQLPDVPASKQEVIVLEFTVPKPRPRAATVVEHVYPSSNKLPENQFRFYIHFSAPMAQGEAYQHIRLLDSSGKPIEHSFLELNEELWDGEGKRLTLYLHPGRVKKGLKPREELGPILEAGYYIYHHYVRGAKLSRPIHSWDGKTPPDADVLKLIGRAGTDLVPRPDSAEGKAMGVREETGRVSLPGKNPITVARLTTGPSTIRALEFSIPKESAVAFSQVRLHITWDNRPIPSVDAPVPLFYGTGTLYNRDGRDYLVKAFPIHVRYDQERVHLACYFPMPFFRSAHIELVGADGSSFPDIQWSVRYTLYRDPINHVGYFHATYRDHAKPELGKDLVLLDTTKAEGGPDWSGSFVGTSFIFSHRAELHTLEGDPRFFFDDSQTPQACGTGTEEWGGGGDYWGGRNMTLPFAGHPVGAVNAKSAKDKEDMIESAYRFLLADLMPFGKNARICLEHGGMNESTEHYKTVTYWYGLPGASLILTDELQIGDERSEKDHHYNSPQASAPYEIISRYEWGVDHLKVGGKLVEIYPTHADRGRSTTGRSEFTLKLEPKNLAVLLRRKLDYRFPNQRAEVFVADGETEEPQWKPAGIWYLAGSNTCVYSNPKEELGATQHIVQTSNRRFRDDEFLLPRDLTEGRSAIRVRIQFTPVKTPLFPGHPLPELAWSEIKYSAYCFVMPPLPDLQ